MNEVFLASVQIGMGIIITAGGFVIKMAFDMINKNEDRINKLEVDLASAKEQNKSVFQRLAVIEEKIDRLLAGR